MSRESYAHRCAKQLVCQWLRERAHPVAYDSDSSYSLINLDPVRALVPSLDPLRGVYEEYPLCLTAELRTTLHQPWTATSIPTFDELIARNQSPAYILDIAVLHMGQIKYGLEIVHRHSVPAHKITALQLATGDLPFELYEIDASWVLNQCAPPSRLQVRRLLPAPRRLLPFETAQKEGKVLLSQICP